MDELDRKIISLLQLDGRASNAKIAREVGVSEGTVRRRLRRDATGAYGVAGSHGPGHQMAVRQIA